MMPGDGPIDPPTMGDGEYIQRLEAEVSLLRKFRQCYEKLLVAHRLGKRPSEKCLDTVHALKASEE